MMSLSFQGQASCMKGGGGGTTEEAVQKLYLEKMGNHVENLGIYGVGSLQ